MLPLNRVQQHFLFYNPICGKEGSAKKDSTQAVVYLKTKQEELSNILIFPWWSSVSCSCLLFANKFTSLSELLHWYIARLTISSVHPSVNVTSVIMRSWLPKLRPARRSPRSSLKCRFEFEFHRAEWGLSFLVFLVNWGYIIGWQITY